MDACDSNTRAYKNGKTFDQCREIAKSNSSLLEKKIEQAGTVTWKEILEVSGNDELVYKLTLKYLRQEGYDIGNWKMPRVIKSTA